MPVYARQIKDESPKRRGSTIRSQLTLLVLACVIPASIAAAALVVYNYREYRGDLLHNALNDTRALLAAVDRELEAQQAALSVLATSPYLQNNDLASFYRQANEAFAHRPAVMNVVLIDRAYRQRINTIVPFGTALPIDTGNPGTRRTFENERPVVSDVFVGAVTGRTLISILVPVRQNGKVAYALGTGVKPEQLAELLVGQQLPDGWIGAIFDSTGTIVARTHHMNRFMGKKGSPALVERMSEASEGMLETTTVEGIRVMSVFSRSAVSNWSVAVGIPVATLTGQLWRSIEGIAAGIAILILTTLMTAFTIARRLARSVGALREPALALGEGREVNVPDLHLAEANEVGQALTKASELLSVAKHKATHDPLTGLANRTLLMDILHQQLAVCERTGAKLEVLYIDLDGFKAINDEFGHIVGDEVLRVVATKLKEVTRGADLAARVGGDEFAMVLVDTERDGAAIVAEKLLARISAARISGAPQVKLSASIGIATYPEAGVTGEELLRRADENMYRAKAAGKRQYRVTTL